MTPGSAIHSLMLPMAAFDKNNHLKVGVMMQNEKREEKATIPSIGTINKGGRPKVAVKKDRIISVKCNSWEKKAIHIKAKKSDMTASEFLRKLGLDEEIDPKEKVIPKNIQDLFAAFRHTTSNINQIARRLNMDYEMTPYLQEQLLYHLKELEKLEEKIKAYFQ
jgi:DNA repair ATPase RecN